MDPHWAEKLDVSWWNDCFQLDAWCFLLFFFELRHSVGNQIFSLWSVFTWKFQSRHLARWSRLILFPAAWPTGDAAQRNWNIGKRGKRNRVRKLNIIVLTLIEMKYLARPSKWSIWVLALGPFHICWSNAISVTDTYSSAGRATNVTQISHLQEGFFTRK